MHHGITVTLLSCALLASCSAPKQGEPAAKAAKASQDEAIRAASTMPADWTTWRVGGDLFAKAEFREGSYYSGKCSVTTPLPVGYPAPTPPNAIELKRYPSVRRAEMRMEPSQGVSSQSGRSLAFWPLFQHIQKHEIEMTSPVEMDYPQLKVESSEAAGKDTQAWTMSFLYRTADLGPTGKDGKVQVADNPPLTVISIGMMGPYMASRDIAMLAKVREWLAANPEWKAAGPARSLYYNGPDVMPSREWSEFQVPVTRVQ